MYSKVFRLCLLLLLNSTYLFSQCPTAEIILGSQAEVDNFPTLYPNCDSITVDLFIGDPSQTTLTDITNLDSMTYLRHAQLFFIASTQIENLTGLDSLKTADQFVVVSNPMISSFEGADSLSHIRSFSVNNNDILPNFNGFESLEFVKNLDSSENPELVNFQGLESTKVKNIQVSYAPALLNLSGLEGVDSLTSITLNNNNVLNDISALNNVLQIDDNVKIFNNPALSNCSVEAICDAIVETQGNITIFGNGTGCESAPVVFNNCLGADDYWLTTQEEIDDFKTNNGCINTVDNLIIGLPFQTNVTSNIKTIDNLDCLEFITGHLVVENNDSLSSLSGLDDVKSIAKSFRFNENKRVKNFTPLDQVTSVGGNFQIINNDSLVSTTGFEGISFAYGIFMENNPKLEDVDGFTNIQSIILSLELNEMGLLNLDTGLESLRFIRGEFILYDCPNLTSLASLRELKFVGDNFYFYYIGITNFSGMNNLEFIGGYFYIEELEFLVNMQGLNALKRIGTSFEIYYCYYNLINFNGLENLLYIGDVLYLEENYALNDISALSNLEAIEGDYIVIDECESLSNCSIEPICNFLNDPTKTYDVGFNLPGCNSIEEILAECQTCSGCCATIANTWLVNSAIDTDWHNPANWSLELVPSTCHEVIIPTGSDVLISNAPANCYTLTVEEGAVFDVPSEVLTINPLD